MHFVRHSPKLFSLAYLVRKGLGQHQSELVDVELFVVLDFVDVLFSIVVPEINFLPNTRKGHVLDSSVK